MEVNLASEQGTPSKVEVSLKILKCEITYVDMKKLKLATPCSVENASITFMVDLDRQPCDLDILKAIDPNAHKVADDMIKTSGLSDDVFSIEYLFLKFSEIDLRSLEPKVVKGFDHLPGSATNVALSALNLLIWGSLAPGTDKAGGKFILGSVVRRKTKQPVPNFTMIDFLFDVNSNLTAPAASTLNYLGVFEGRTLPADRGVARLKVRDHWVQPAQIDGTEGTISGVMGISKQRFMDEYLIPKFNSAINNIRGIGSDTSINVQPRIEGLKWTFSYTFARIQALLPGVGPWVPIAGNNFRTNGTCSFEVVIEILPNSNNLSVYGKVEVNLDCGEHDWLDDFSYLYDSNIPLSGTCKIIEGGENSTDLTMAAVLEHHFGSEIVTKKEKNGFGMDQVWTLNFLDKVNEVSTKAYQTVMISLEKCLDESLKQVSIELSQHKFIPPGGGVFTFQDPIFSQAGDLIFPVIYKAP